MNALISSLVLFYLAVLLAGCGGGKEGETAASASYTIALSTSQNSVLTDNSDTAVITAQVTNDNNVAVEGVAINFSATAGLLHAGEVLTDTSGQAPVNFTSGVSIASITNQTATITASAIGSTSKTIPIRIIGSTVTLSSAKSTLGVGEETTLTLTTKNAAGITIPGATFVALADPAPAVNLSPTSGTTDNNGTASLIVTRLAADTDVDVTVSALGASDTERISFTITGGSFGIIEPTVNPAYIAIGSELNIKVSAQAPTTTVRFATSSGSFSSSDPSLSWLDVPVSSGEATATLFATDAGMATITVTDTANTMLTDSLSVSMAASPIEATQIILHAPTVILPSSTDETHTVTIQATVRDVDDQPVSGSVLVFTLTNPTGGGETVIPTAITDPTGRASVLFTSGTLSSGAEGITVTAEVTNGSFTGLKDSVVIVIGGTAGSIAISGSTEIESLANETLYKSVYTVLVTDANGNPVPNTNVTLNIWPSHYFLGIREAEATYQDWPEGSGIVAQPNEDINKNIILDLGEDIGPMGVGDGQLTPHNSDAGAIPRTITTNSEGYASFDHLFGKDFGHWLKVELTASAVVQGSETTTIKTFVLPIKQGDEDKLGPSPYGS